MKVIDSHVHVFPDVVGDFLESAEAPTLAEGLAGLRRFGRKKLAPIRRGLHGLQPLLRHVPESTRRKTDVLGYSSVLSNLLIEGTPGDLLEAMDEDQVDGAVVIASPPFATNEYVVALGERNPRLAPIVNFPPDSKDAPAELERLHRRGARGLKIHAAIDGAGPDSTHYLVLLEKAAELRLPVIIHTGCIHVKLVYKDPDMGRAELFERWFRDFPETPFVLAHMSFHSPEVALRLAEEHGNLHVDTSWQPPEIIGKAIRSLGAERVMFGTDWPLVGDNIAVGLKRIRACIDNGTVKEDEAALVLGTNASRLFRLGE